MTQDSRLTIEEIQGRLNQREIPWLAAAAGSGDPRVSFTPKDGGGVLVGWDRGEPGARSFDDVLDFLDSYVGA